MIEVPPPGPEDRDVILIHTGGTITQVKGKNGRLQPSTEPIEQILERHPNLTTKIRITYDEFEEPIDSTNMTHELRTKLAKKVEKHLHPCNGIVITHGTDTLAETAAALNYMLPKTNSPVILTGSQRSIYEPINDAESNLYYAIRYANELPPRNDPYPGPIIVFGQHMLTGSRSIKISEHSLNAFTTPRSPILLDIGYEGRPEYQLKDNIFVGQETPRPSLSVLCGSKEPSELYDGKPTFSEEVFTNFETRVEYIEQVSGNDSSLLEHVVNDENVKGIVIGAFGAGNIQEKNIELIKRAHENEKIVVATTNCMLGSTNPGIYAVGAGSLENVITSGDITTEATIQKLMYSLGIINAVNMEDHNERVKMTRILMNAPRGNDMTINPQEEMLYRLFTFVHDVMRDMATKGVYGSGFSHRVTGHNQTLWEEFPEFRRKVEKFVEMQDEKYFR